MRKKLILFAEDMIVWIENPKQSIKHPPKMKYMSSEKHQDMK